MTRAGLAFLMGAVGIGALAGALALSVRTPVKMMRTIIVSLATFGIALGAIGFTHARLVIVPLLAVCGCAMVVCVALCNTSIQQRIPDAMRGRVLSMYTFAFFGFPAVREPACRDRWPSTAGLPLTMMVLGGGIVAAAVGAVVVARAT